MRIACGSNADFDRSLSARFKQNTRIRQFSTALGDYLVAAGALPRDLSKRVEAEVFGI